MIVVSSDTQTTVRSKSVRRTATFAEMSSAMRDL